LLEQRRGRGGPSRVAAPPFDRTARAAVPLQIPRAGSVTLPVLTMCVESSTQGRDKTWQMDRKCSSCPAKQPASPSGHYTAPNSARALLRTAGHL